MSLNLKTSDNMKETIRKIIYLILFTLLIFCFIYLGKKDFTENITDGEKFSREYSGIPTNNPFVYVNSSKVLSILENDTGIILIGFSSNKWMQEYVKELYPILIDNNINKVYYYDLSEDRVKKLKNFREIEDILSTYLKITDTGDEYLFTPALVFVSNGEIINYDDETSLVSLNMNPSTYWNSEKEEEFRNKIETFLSEADYTS